MSRNENETKEVPHYIPILAGGCSGVITRFICHPLDVIKIRFQLQVEPIRKSSKESKYRTIPQAFRLIVKEEGLAALWKAHISAQLLSATYGLVQFGTYDALLRKAKQFPKFSNNKAKVQFVCGFVSGCFATVATSPFDIIRTRLILQGKTKAYRNSMDGLIHILQHDGFRGFYRGLTPTLMQIGPYSGIQFASYHFCRRLFDVFGTKHDMKSKWFSLSETAVSGSLAGFTAKIATYPLDLAKKRLQFQGFQEARKGYGKNFVCSNLITCITETVRVEKTQGLFKGLSPSLIKASVTNALIFTIYEEVYSFLVLLHKSTD